MLTAAEIISMLDLQPHLEGGHWRETFRDPQEVAGRSVATGGYLLLAQGDRSDWRHLDAAELWQFYEGAPLQLAVADEDGKRAVILGPDASAGHRIQAATPKGAWQAARTLGDWTLLSCTIGPDLDFSAFEVAPVGVSEAAETDAA